MNYISVNSLGDFEFHDAELSLGSFSQGVLKLDVDFLNIHSSAEQNPFEMDMEIENGHICFEGFKLISYEIGQAWQRDENGELYTDDPKVVLYDDEALERFKAQLKKKITVLDLGALENGAYYMDAISDDPYFVISFTFENITIQWDGYTGEACYVKHNN